MVIITLIIFATSVASYIVGIKIGRRLERMEKEDQEEDQEEENVGNLISHVGYDAAQCGREK